MSKRTVRPSVWRARGRAAGWTAVLLALATPAWAADGPVVLKAPADLILGLAAVPQIASAKSRVTGRFTEIMEPKALTGSPA